MFCNNCGKTLPEGTAFCDNCGASQSAIPAQQVSHQTVNYYNVQPYNPGKGFGAASMILGIVAALLPCFSCIPYVGWVISFLSLPCALLAIIFGIVGKSKSRSAGCKNGMATAGLILGIIYVVLIIVAAIALAVIALIGGIGILGAAAESANAYSYY